MFIFEHLQLNTSFIMMPPDSTVEEVQLSLKRFDFMIIDHHPFFVLSKEDRIDWPDRPGVSIMEWLRKKQWLPSERCHKTELFSEQKIGWKRPIVVCEDKRTVIGIMTAEQWISHLWKENKSLAASFHVLAETVNEAVTAVNSDGVVVCWNSAAEQTYGIQRKDILHRKMEQSGRGSIYLHRILNEGKPVRQLYAQSKPENHVLINASPILRDNQMVGGIATEQNITPIVQLNEELYDVKRKALDPEHLFASIQGKTPAMQQVIQLAKKISDTDAPVWIISEPGSEKERLAHAIHCSGNRKDAPFLSLHCATIPAGLLEAELFGYRNGAFSDNPDGKPGKLEQAANGTLYIEEIQEMPLEIQGKLLHFLRHQNFYPVGSSKPIKTNTRIIASSSHPRNARVQQERLLEDLFYQLNVFAIELPPLRKRVKDIPELVQATLGELSLKYQKPIPKLEPAVMSALMNHNWPGNMKELRNVIERIVILCEEEWASADLLPKEFAGDHRDLDLDTDAEQESEIANVPVEMTMKVPFTDSQEAVLIKEALRKTYGNKSAAAKLLGISRGTLYNKLKEYKI